MSLYERVILLCSQNNITKTQLERELKISQNSINKWKNSMPSMAKIHSIANYFNVSAEYLLFGTDKPSYEEKKKEAVSLIEELTPDEIKKLLEYKDFLISQRNKK